MNRSSSTKPPRSSETEQGQLSSAMTVKIMLSKTKQIKKVFAVLFMTEISAAAITAAIWAGEPFGIREVSGVILISAAGIFEPVLNLFRAGS